MCCLLLVARPRTRGGGRWCVVEGFCIHHLRKSHNDGRSERARSAPQYPQEIVAEITCCITPDPSWPESGGSANLDEVRV